MEQYKISVNGVQQISLNCPRRGPSQELPQWLRSLKEYKRQLVAEDEHLEKIIRASKHMISATEIYERMGYVFKQGNIVVKLLDKAVWELRTLGTDIVYFDHRVFLRKVLPREDRDHRYLMVDECSNQCEDSFEGDWKIFRRAWNIRICIEHLFLCKKNVLLEQIVFLVERIRMTAFIGEVKNHKAVSHSNRSNNRTRTQMISLSRGMDPVVEKNQGRLAVVMPSRFEVACRLLGPSTRSFKQTLYEVIKNSLPGAQIANRSNDYQRIFCQNSYNLLWNNTYKEYCSPILTDHETKESKKVVSFIGGLNANIKHLLQCKEDTSLTQSLKESATSVCFLLVLFVVGILLAIFAEGTVTLVICFSLCLGCLGAVLLRVLRQEIYSQTLFRSSIKQELSRHYESGKHCDVYEMQPTGYDIRVIVKRGDE